MATSLSQQVRELAVREYVRPARKNGGKVVIPIGEIQKKLLIEGFPPNHMRQIYTSLESKRLFREPLGLVLETPPGQAVRVGTVLRFRIADHRSSAVDRNRSNDPLLSMKGILSSEHHQDKRREKREEPEESSKEWAARVTSKLSGLLKEEIAAFGGAEAFMKWVRSDHDGEEAE